MASRTKREALTLLIERVQSTLDAIGDNEFPYLADPRTGEWETTADGNWCGGHWIEMCWMAADLTDDARFTAAAKGRTNRLKERHPTRNMFFGMNCQYAGFNAFDITNDDEHATLGLRGADAMVEYFHEPSQQIPLGTLAIKAPASNFRGPGSSDGLSGDRLGAVDAIYTALPVLWRAYRETGDIQYRNTAIAHADRHLDWYIRDDGRTWHHAAFEPDTGDLVTQYNELAYSDESCWARGQGWCIAGLAQAYRETGADRYARALRRTVDYYVEHSPEDLVPHWDFEHPDKPAIERDTSAAALTAYGLTVLNEDSRLEDLASLGDAICSSLIKNYLTPRSADEDRPRGMVLESCYNGPAGFSTANEHIWTDYYLMKTLYKSYRSGEFEWSSA